MRRLTFDDIANGEWWDDHTGLSTDWVEEFPDMREVDWQEMLNPDEGDKG
jgi:hypothetical protein